MDRLQIGVVEVTSVSGVVSVGRTVIRQSVWTGKGQVAAGALTGDFGVAALGFGVLADADGLDGPVQVWAEGRAPS